MKLLQAENELLKKLDIDVYKRQTQGRSFTKPWFGQLMTGPQVIAYLIQLETWLNEYNVKLDI